MSVHESTHLPEHVEAEADVCVYLKFFCLIFSGKFSHWTWSLSFQLQAHLRTSWIHLPLRPLQPFTSKAGVTGIHLAQLLYACWGYKLKSSCRHSERFAHCTISPTPYIGRHTMLCCFGEGGNVEAGSHCIVLADLGLTDHLSLCPS